MNKNLLLIGGGGHCISVLEALFRSGASRFELIGIIDSFKEKGSSVYKTPVVGYDEDLPFLIGKYRYAFISLGSIGNWEKRLSIYKTIETLGYKIPNIFHSSAIVSKYCQISSGVFIAAGAVINAACIIDKSVIINTRSVIEHECHIEAFAHISPGAILCGGVSVGEGSHIGAGSVVRQGIKIGKNSLVGVGSVVVADVPDNVVAYGNPCRVVGER